MKSSLILTSLLASALALPVMAQNAGNARPVNPSGTVAGDTSNTSVTNAPAASPTTHSKKKHHRKSSDGGSANTDGGTSSPGTGASVTTGVGSGPSTTPGKPRNTSGSYGGGQ